MRYREDCGYGFRTASLRSASGMTSGVLMPYLINTVTRRIQWGECDPAGIVFYPRYFEMFDAATTAMFSAATGLTKHQMFETYRFAGYPMVDTRARFLIPCHFGDDVTIKTTMT